MFIKKHFLKIASVLLAVITIAVFSGFAANAERMFPHNPISEDSKTDLEPEIIYNENSGNKLSEGKNGDSEDSNGRGDSSGESSENPNRNNLPDNIKNNDTQKEDDKTPETDKDESGADKPSIDYVIDEPEDGNKNGNTSGSQNGGGSGN